ncbi:hypothetical protein EUX98_g4750 [Antrodiella citrinella]|uniref:Lytic polysaccharide monooxygenase n=1 Tax=Antrodiella citrinella TaxID=2447956 RepID=A0A4S4MT91_9APHY|nr:hypothetical protein EUX98_g4750 [Antrodiella citrinella]
MISAASLTALLTVAALAPRVASHASIWHNSMWGFNVTAQTYSYDNRAQVPLMNMPFSQWWFHGHLDHPPNDGDFFELPAGGAANAEISCDKGSTSWFASSAGGNAGYPTDNVCVGQPMSEYHTTGINDLGGCGLGIVYESDVTQVNPEDFAIFSTNATCPWTLNTDFQVPAAMPACPDAGCICAWFWIHRPDSGSEQMYMTGFRCKVTGASGTTAIGKPALARRCGADPANGVQNATPSNCTVGPKQPFYWDQTEQNNMFEGLYSPPLYTDLYGYVSGAQNDIFQAATVNGVKVFGDNGDPVPISAPPAGSGSSSSAAPAPPASTPAAAPSSSPVASSAPAKDTPAPAPASPAPSSEAPASSKAAPSTEVPAPAPSSSAVPTTAPSPVNPPPQSLAAVTTATITTSQAPASTKQCNSSKKRSHGAKKRHLGRRLSHDLH